MVIVVVRPARVRGEYGDMAANSNTEILRMHGLALDFFSAGVHAVRDDQWDAPTPDTQWSVRDLVNHLVVEQLWVPPLVRDGRTIAQVGDAFEGDQLGDDPVGTWDRASEAARAAFQEPGALDRIAHLSYADTPGAAYCAQMTTDAAVHGWDLARAIGADERMPDGLAAAALREVKPYASGLHNTGLFAPPVPAPSGADDQTKLLSLLGRKP
jgi:uncharacterized protein (TIGR03086 family)